MRTNTSKNIVIVGGDGFIGWPLAVQLKEFGHNIIIVDNLSRRALEQTISGESLCPLSSAAIRSSITNIPYIIADIISDEGFISLTSVLTQNIDIVVHLAQIRSAPHSMRSASDRITTISHNNSATIAILEAIRIVNTNIAVVHIGTMGVYGYNSSVVHEGHNGDTLVDMNPGSVYHLSKCHDQLTFKMYCSMYNMNIIDLHQGIVWGSQTSLTKSDPLLFNRYDYDEFYGTVFNRFIAQAAAKGDILIYGTGEQKRAFIHIEDSIKCLVSVITNSSYYHGFKKVMIANQFTEIIEISALANTISQMFETKITFIPNPRKESDGKKFAAVNNKIKEMLADQGKKLEIVVQPKTIQNEFMFANKFMNRYSKLRTTPTVKW
jgi:UDP-sulfoquinovose synthase